MKDCCVCSGCRYFSFTHALAVTAMNFYLFFGTDVFNENSKVKTLCKGLILNAAPVHLNLPTHTEYTAMVSI